MTKFLNKKPTFEADSSESRNDTIKSVLTAIYSLADQKILSSLTDLVPYRAHSIFIISRKYTG